MYISWLAGGGGGGGGGGRGRGWDISSLKPWRNALCRFLQFDICATILTALLFSFFFDRTRDVIFTSEWSSLMNRNRIGVKNSYVSANPTDSVSKPASAIFSQ